MGTHFVAPGPATAVGSVADAPLTPPVHPAPKMMPIHKQRPKKPAAKPLAVKKGSLAAINVVYCVDVYCLA
jgi:hypothetical protein